MLIETLHSGSITNSFEPGFAGLKDGLLSELGFVEGQFVAS